MVHIVSLSTSPGGMGGVNINYDVVKDYCQKYELDVMDTFSIVKSIVARVYG